MLGNVDRILYFKKDQSENMLLPPQFQAAYGFEPDGVNYYVGVNSDNVAGFRHSGLALHPWNGTFLKQVVKWLNNSSEPSKLLVLSLEPPPGTPEGFADPFDYVAQNLDYVAQIAKEVNSYIHQTAAGKTLQVILRYASEMNDVQASNPYGQFPDGYKQTFSLVRTAMLAQAPSLQFCFSPAMRADLNPTLRPDTPTIQDYWPGDDLVDYISGTWYITDPIEAQDSTDFMASYYTWAVSKGKPLGIDELGGCDATGHNDAVLQQMLASMQTVPNAQFDYATFFLAEKFGADATLGWIPQELGVS